MREIKPEEMKEVQLNIFKFFDELCRKNNIKYSLDAGSLIGAIRHNGMIPWDDDIDVILDRENYEKFIEVAKTAKHEYIRILHREIDEEYPLPFIKISDIRTYLREDGIIELKNMGVNIDVFVYDKMPNESKLQNLYLDEREFYLKATEYYRFEDTTRLKENFPEEYNYAKNHTIEFVLAELEKARKKYNNDEAATKMITNWPIYPIEREIQDAGLFTEYMDHEFDGINAMITKGYHELLTHRYGDYMTPPPEEKRVSHHHFIAGWRE